MNILYIDPWCVNGPNQNSNLYHYSTGLVGGISKYADVTLVSQVYCTFDSAPSYEVIKLFFPRSNGMKKGPVRSIVRGIEYISAYKKIYKIASKKHYDIIHIEWPLLYKYDLKIFQRLKRKCTILSLKAHNVLPHSTGNKYLDVFRAIYSVPDVILVHGESLYDEFNSLFPEFISKVRIQRHGAFLSQNHYYSVENIDRNLDNRIKNAKRVYVFLGRIDKDKGVDRLAEIWCKYFIDSSSILIIAGKVSDDFDEKIVYKYAETSTNLIFLPGFIDDNLFNYLVDNSNLILLTYYAGSMSGVAFTAAEFSRTFLATDFGAIKEYVNSGKDAFVVENTENSIIEALKMIEKKTNKELSEMGAMLNTFYHEEFSWDSIACKLVKDVYSKLLDKETNKNETL